MSEQPILQVQSVSKRFGGVHALENVSVDLFPGEVLALAGDNGAGKSTLIKIISGVHHPDEGKIWYNGAEVTFENPQKAREQGIETIYQDLALADNLDVGANVFLGREPMKRVFEPLAGPLVTELAHDGDPAAAEVVQLLGERLGVVITSLANIFNPQIVVVGGGVIAAGELLLAPARRIVKERTLPFFGDDLRIVAARFGVEAGMVGAAALAYEGLAQLEEMVG